MKILTACCIACFMHSSAPPAHAASCADLTLKLVASRNAALIDANQSPKRPEIFCPKAATLHVAEEALIAFMIRNQAKCAFPDSAIAELEGHAQHNQNFAWYCR